MTGLVVLYVDDDDDIRTIVRLALSLDPTITLHMAGSAAEALTLVAQGLRPDVALLDVMMPGGDGLSLLDRLRANPATRTLPVIFMTANGRDADVAHYRARGAMGVIVKPFDPIRLAGELRAMLEGDSAAPSA